jgi:hypothetical protein
VLGVVTTTVRCNGSDDEVGSIAIHGVAFAAQGIESQQPITCSYDGNVFDIQWSTPFKVRNLPWLRYLSCTSCAVSGVAPRTTTQVPIDTDCCLVALLP